MPLLAPASAHAAVAVEEKSDGDMIPNGSSASTLLVGPTSFSNSSTVAYSNDHTPPLPASIEAATADGDLDDVDAEEATQDRNHHHHQHCSAKHYDAAPADLAVDQRNSESAVRWGKALFILSLCGAAFALGFSAFRVLTKTERMLADRQFEAIAKRAVFSAQAITLRKRLGSISMADILANAHPDASREWPYVYLHGFESMSNKIIKTSDGRSMAFCPIIYDATLEKIEAYNAFAYEYYQNMRRPQPFPNSTGLHPPFGEGIFAMTSPSQGKDVQYFKAVDGSTRWGGEGNLVAPIFHHNGGPVGILMFNMYSEPMRGNAIDNMIACAAQRQKEGNMTVECGEVTDKTGVWTPQMGVSGPAALIFQPIYPSYDPFTLSGFIGTSIVWSETLQNVFDSTVNGIDCVVETETQVFSYRIKDGVPEDKDVLMV